MSTSKGRVLMAMSGGVDSSVGALRLQKEGYEVIGATMKTFCYSDIPAHGKTCCGLDGIMDAKAVADKLGIPHYVFDVEKTFKRDVIDNFVSEYAKGRTPNPCVRCNSYTKFQDLLHRAEALGCDYIATGHYLKRTDTENGTPVLLRGDYLPKDQSYFLWGVDKDALKKMLFPVGNLEKAEVRAMARGAKLVTADKAESMEICFVPDDDYAGFVERRVGEDHEAFRKGDFVTSEGEVIGQHDGFARFTVGQRKGLPGGRSKRLYVLDVVPETQEIVVGDREDLNRSVVEIENPHWLVDSAPTKDTRVQIQIRHRSEPSSGVIESVSAEKLVVKLDEPRVGVTPGQSGVVYLPWAEDEAIYRRLAGGGVISGARK